MTNEQIEQNAKAYAIKVCEETPIDYSVVSNAYIAGVSQIMTPELKELIANAKSEFDALERIQQHEDYENKTKDEWEMMTTIFFNLTKIYETLKPLI